MPKFEKDEIIRTESQIYEGMNIPQILDAQAEKRPDKIWLVHGKERMTFKEFGDRTDHLAVALQKQGLKKGEPCGLLFPNGIPYLLLQFAILKVGAILVPLNTRYRTHELNFMLHFTDARFLFTVKQFLKADFTEIIAEIRPNLPRLERLFVDGDRIPEGMLDIKSLFQYRASEDEIGSMKNHYVKDTEPASILFTSGTTAQPKGVLNSHQARVWTGIRNCERMQITEEDVLLNPLPFCHEFGGFTIPSHAYLCGCKMVIMDLFDAEEALRLIEVERVSVLYGVPTMFSYMLRSPKFKEYRINSLRTGYMSGATCPLELVRAVQEEMGCNISVAYGLSESPCHTISEYDVSPEVKAKTIGKPVRDAEAKVVDDHRQKLPIGTPGEIALRGKNLFLGYYKNDQLTHRVVDPEGFLYTSDLGKMDEKGYLYFLGRKADLIIAGGFNIYPPEVEEVIFQLPFVALAAVVGLPDPELGEIVCACIVLREGTQATAEEVIDFCKKQLANYKVPKRVEFMDSLPSTLATNKIRKSALVEDLKSKIDREKLKTEG
jgi:fatty-acyl-CoA synthase